MNRDLTFGAVRFEQSQFKNGDDFRATQNKALRAIEMNWCFRHSLFLCFNAQCKRFLSML